MPSMAVMTGGCATGKVFLSLYSPSSISIFFLSRSTFRRSSLQPKVYLRFNPILCFSTAVTAPAREESAQNLRYSLLIDRLRIRHLKEGSKGSLHNPTKPVAVDMQRNKKKKDEKESIVVSCFEELGLKEEVLGAIREMGISVPTEIQAIGVPAVLQRKNVVLGSHTGSGKTLAYMLPLVQLLKHDEELSGVLMKPRRPRAVVLCPTRELTEQVFRVAKSISHHARFRSILISGGGRSRPQEDLLKVPFDVVVGTPGRILQHIEDGNLVYGDIKYLVLDEADTMFDKGFGPDIRKFLGPLRNRVAKPGGQGFQTVLVTATMTKAVQKLIDNEFEGILHLQTSTLHKKIASARHDFIKLLGAENKLESLQQVLKPSLTKGNRVMVFCNTLNSSRAVDHFLTENQFYTVNYHGEVPAEERAENLKQFKCNEGDCPTLVCTDLAARGLDLDVDHVIMFDFPKNSIDYLHRTGRTARMGAKGRITSLVTKRDLLLADRIEEALRKNESLEGLNQGSIWRDAAKPRPRQADTKQKSSKATPHNLKPRIIGRKAALAASRKSTPIKSFGRPASPKSTPIKSAGRSASQKSTPIKSVGRSASKKSTPIKSVGRSASQKSTPIKSVGRSATAKPRRPPSNSDIKWGPKSAPKATRNARTGAAASAGSKLSIVGFRGRSSIGKKAGVARS